MLVALLVCAYITEAMAQPPQNMTSQVLALMRQEQFRFKHAVANITQQVGQVNLTQVVENVVGKVEHDDLDFALMFGGLIVMCLIFVTAMSRVFSK